MECSKSRNPYVNNDPPSWILIDFHIDSSNWFWFVYKPEKHQWCWCFILYDHFIRSLNWTNQLNNDYFWSFHGGNVSKCATRKKKQNNDCNFLFWCYFFGWFKHPNAFDLKTDKMDSLKRYALTRIDENKHGSSDLISGIETHNKKKDFFPNEFEFELLGFFARY